MYSESPFHVPAMYGRIVESWGVHSIVVFITVRQVGWVAWLMAGVEGMSVLRTFWGLSRLCVPNNQQQHMSTHRLLLLLLHLLSPAATDNAHVRTTIQHTHASLPCCLAVVIHPTRCLCPL